MSLTEWREEQEKDQDINKVLAIIEGDQLFRYRSNKSDSTDLQHYLKTRRSLCLVSNLLYQQTQLKHHHSVVNQFVLPKLFRKRMVLACHDEMRHFGMDRKLLLLQDQVYWPGMSKDVREHI